MNNLTFKALPFIYQLKDTLDNDAGIPNSLPFTLTVDKRYDLVKQQYNPVVDEALTKAYQISSILGGNTTEDEIGDGYTNAILEFIERHYVLNKASNKVLDIGCGTGYLLKKLKDQGYRPFGIEPGNQSKIGIEKYGIPIITGFFPSKEIIEKFDLIISTLVLEHIASPEVFLKEIKNSLVQDGTVIIGVPNEEPYIKTGDISTLFHEHWNYFTEKSFYNFLKNNGAINIVVEKSSYGGLLYAKFNFSKNLIESEPIKETEQEGDSYLHKIKNASVILREFFIANKDKSIGIYVPGRIVNFIMSEKIEATNIRFFDDDQNSYGLYYPGINIKVENFSDLLKKPTDMVLIMSSFFSEKIKTKIAQNTNVTASKIVTWKDVFNSEIKNE